MSFQAINRNDLDWSTAAREDGKPARHVAHLTDAAGFTHSRANMWRYEPGGKGKRHRHPAQEETFIVLEGALSVYLGDPPERVEVTAGGLVNVPAGTAMQLVNDGSSDAWVYAYGCPPDNPHGEMLDPAV